MKRDPIDELLMAAHSGFLSSFCKNKTVTSETFTEKDKQGIDAILICVAAGGRELVYIDAIFESEGSGLKRDHFLSPDENGVTALHCAVRTEFTLKEVAAIVECHNDPLKKSDFLVKDKKGATPLHEASASETIDLVAKILAENGETFSFEELKTLNLWGHAGSFTMPERN
jgi:ankyrin repeat protein